MIAREIMQEIVRGYDPEKVKVGVLASHSALDVCDGAVDEGFRTVCYCQKGREQTYTRFFKSKRVNGRCVRGCVDEYHLFDRFSEMTHPDFQERMISDNIMFIPNRSFTAYCGVEAIEEKFKVPFVGSRNLLASEERGSERDYYWLLDRAGLPYPEKIDDPEKIDSLCIVKLPHAKKRLERGFFTAADYEEYQKKSRELMKTGVITEEDLAAGRIERYIIGPVFNFDFFYSPLAEGDEEPIELIGIDYRYETSLDGHVRLPASQQITLRGKQHNPEYTVCGHSGATVRESLLEPIFKIAEKWVVAAKEHYSPGIIGAFCLQTCVDEDLHFFIYDVAPRIGGGTNYHMWTGHPYGNMLWRSRVSSGRRTAMEIKMAVESERIDEIVT